MIPERRKTHELRLPPIPAYFRERVSRLRNRESRKPHAILGPPGVEETELEVQESQGNLSAGESSGDERVHRETPPEIFRKSPHKALGKYWLVLLVCRQPTQSPEQST